MLALIILSVIVGWFLIAGLLALAIGRAVRIADRNQKCSLATQR